MKSETLIGYRVITQQEGKDLGSVLRLVFDGANRRAAALVLEEKDSIDLNDVLVVPWEQIQKIGENAVIIQNAESCQKAGTLPAIFQLLEQKLLMPGAKIYTEDGTGLGHMKDVIFEESDGTIVAYELSMGLMEDTINGTRLMPAIYNLRIGEDVIFVDPQAAKDLRVAPPDFQSSAEAVKKQVSASLSEESLKRSANQLQKSIDTAAAQFKRAWRGDAEPTVPPENKVP